MKGTFKDPHVGVNAAALAVRGGAMIGLGLINPFAALIPLIAPSNGKPLPCNQLLANERTRPVAPQPGHREKPQAPLSLDGTPLKGAVPAAAADRKPAAPAAPDNRAVYRGS